ncbi:MAG: hypothetical protein V3U82_06125 [Robiginitomaculum sp.]
MTTTDNNKQSYIIEDNSNVRALAERKARHAIERIIEELIVEDKLGKSKTAREESYFYQLHAAASLGYLEPFSKEQAALNTILGEFKADKSQCLRAWKLYSELAKSR